MDEIVYTPLGRGKVVHELPNGQLVVEFPHGGGAILPAWEIFGRQDEEVQEDEGEAA